MEAEEGLITNIDLQVMSTSSISRPFLQLMFQNNSGAWARDGFCGLHGLRCSKRVGNVANGVLHHSSQVAYFFFRGFSWLRIVESQFDCALLASICFETACSW
jgi:hypothetical protein